MRSAFAAHAIITTVCAIAVSAAASSRPALADSWPELPPEELAATAPRVQPDADAEALYWAIRAEDVFSGTNVTTEVHHHLRIRVFTQTGGERLGQVRLAYPGNERIRDVEARTVQPDGRAIPVRSRDIFDRVIAGANRQRMKAISFAFPGVAPGVILEYRWTEIRYDEGLNTLLWLQRDVPVQRLVCSLKPISFGSGPQFRYTTHNTTFSTLTPDKSGYLTGTMTNVPAYRYEPMMPPTIESSPWVAMFYQEQGDDSGERFWDRFGRELDERNRATLSTASAIRKTAQQVVGDAATDDDKLRRLYDYCRRDIRNLSRARLSEEERRQIEWPQSVLEALERHEGSGGDINRLFASLALSLGFDARIARVADREVSTFNEAAMLPWLLSSSHVVVRVGDGWRSFDPATAALPVGQLRWQEEGQQALIPDSKRALWTQTPRSGPEGARTRRFGAFRLLEDGTLEGEVRSEYSGHAGILLKDSLENLDVVGRENDFKRQLQERLPSAEPTAIRFENLDGPDLPVVVRYHLRVPEYAAVTGRRLVFPPAVFQAGRRALFPDERRTHPVDFHYAWSEYDSVLILLPDGFELDHADAPPRLSIGDIGEYTVRIGVGNDGKLLVFRREFWFNQVRFSRSQYPVLRETFGTIHERDGHGIAIRRVTTSSQ